MWQNKKGNIFRGGYDYDKKGVRFFELISLKNKARVTFKSPTAAKKAGWKKVA